jgi:hypothetical protein
MTRSAATLRAIRNPVSTVGQILPQHRRQQSRSLVCALVQCTALQQRQQREPVSRPGFDQDLPGGRIIPVDLRFGGAGVVIPLVITVRNWPVRPASVAASSPRIAERSNVIVSIVATAS